MQESSGNIKKKTLLFVFGVLASSLIFLSLGVYGKTVEELKAERDALKEQQSATAKEYNQVNEDIEIYENELEELEKQVTEYEDKIDSLNSSVESATKEKGSLEEQLQNVSQSYETTKDLLYARLRVLYENGFINLWEILFTSSDIMEFINKYNVVVSLIEYDKNMLTAMKSQKDYISKLKQDAELRATKIEQAQFDLKTTQATLELLQSNKQSKLNNLVTAKARLEELKSKLTQDMEKAEKDLQDAIIAASQGYNGTFSGQFGWPVQGSCVLTTSFNEWYCPFGVWYQHWNGIDLARSASYTTEIYAVADGIVTKVGFDSSAGNHVGISHGTSGVDGAKYDSIYYHLKSYKVKKGDYVYKGQVIGIMGTTGSSTGVHLHFGLIKNGKHVDPLSSGYLSYKKSGSWYWAID